MGGTEPGGAGDARPDDPWGGGRMTPQTKTATATPDMVDIDPGAFRQVLAHLPTGVTVIASHGSEGPVGMAANSVTSVSLDPPLILFCPAKSSSTWPKIREAGSFCVNVMAGHHEVITRQFAAKEADRFSGVDYAHRPT